MLLRMVECNIVGVFGKAHHVVALLAYSGRCTVWLGSFS